MTILIGTRRERWPGSQERAAFPSYSLPTLAKHNGIGRYSRKQQQHAMELLQPIFKCELNLTSLLLCSAAMVYSAPLIPVLAVVGQILASPTPAFPPLNTSSLAGNSTTPSACDSIYHCRTLWNLVYGCIITIFYLSFHPDIPDRTHTLWRIRVTRICSVLVGFLVPELMVARAALQWRQVRMYKPEIQGMPQNLKSTWYS